MHKTPTFPVLPFLPLKAALRQQTACEKLWRPSDAAPSIQPVSPSHHQPQPVNPVKHSDKAAA